MESSHKSFFLKMIKNLDIFGAEVNFRIENKKLHQSYFGGFVSIVFIIFAFLYVMKYFILFATRGNMSLIFTNKILDSNPLVNLTESKFNIAFGLNSLNSSFTKSFTEENFNYSFNLVEWIGTDDIRKSEIPFEICKYENFPSNTNENIFNMNGINELFCPNLRKIKNFTLSGLYTDYLYQYLEINISLKSKSQKDYEEIDQKILHSGLKLEIYFLDTALNYDNLTQPLPKYINNYYTSIGTKNLKNLKLYFSTLQFSSDENILYDNPYYKRDIMFDKAEEYSQIISKEDSSQRDEHENVIASISLNASQKYYIVNRSYQKFPDLLAILTGLLSQVLFIFMLVVGYSNKNSLQKKIISKVLKFEGKKTYDIEYLTQIFNKPLSLTLENNISAKNSLIVNSQGPAAESCFLQNNNSYKSETKQNNLNLIKVSHNKIQSNSFTLPKIVNFSYVSEQKIYNPKRLEREESFQRDKIPNEILTPTKTDNQIIIFNKPDLSKMGLRRKFLKLKTIDVVLSKVTKCCKRKQKDDVKKILTAGKEKLFFYLDVITYIKKMQELDIMKYLILSSDELNIFRFLSKPLISTNDISSSVYKEFEQEQKKSLTLKREEIDILRESYRNIMKKSSLSNIEDKLIHLFDAELDGLKLREIN
jgi:hypothetical protein